MEFWALKIEAGKPADVLLKEDEQIYLTQVVVEKLKYLTHTVAVLLEYEGAEEIIATLVPNKFTLHIFRPNKVLQGKFKFSHDGELCNIIVYGYKALKLNLTHGFPKPMYSSGTQAAEGLDIFQGDDE